MYRLRVHDDIRLSPYGVLGQSTTYIAKHQPYGQQQDLHSTLQEQCSSYRQLCKLFRERSILTQTPLEAARNRRYLFRDSTTTPSVSRLYGSSFIDRRLGLPP